MKGEHRIRPEQRKELRTNTLADFLGRTVQKTRSEGLPWTKIFLGVLVLVVLAVGWFIWQGWGRGDPEAWAKVQQNDIRDLQELLKDYPDTTQGQVAEFTLGVGLLSRSIEQMLGLNKQEGQQGVMEMRGHFEKLAEKCQNDPPRAAEAKFHVAVANEALATLDETFLKEAKKSLESITSDEKMKETGYGKLAEKRLAQYNNPTEMAAITKFYAEFQPRSKFAAPQISPPK